MLILNQNKRIKVRYKELHSFDRDKEDVVIAYDWFDVKADPYMDTIVSTMLKMISAQEYYFFIPSRRNGAKKQMLDACAVSKIPTHLIEDVEYSPIYSRLKVIKMMKEGWHQR